MEILISLIVGIVLVELYVWLDPFAKWLVRWAAKRLPDTRDEEFIAQWDGDLATVPNSIFKVYFVLRDCVLPIKAIQQMMFREEFAELADDFDRLIDKVEVVDKLLKRSVALLADSERSVSRLVGDLNTCTKRLQQLQQGEDAQNAIDHLRALSPPAAEKLSEFHAGLVRYHAHLEELATSVREPLARAKKHRIVSSSGCSIKDPSTMMMLE